MSNNSNPHRHVRIEWRRGFCELVAGKPFFLCPDKPDRPYRVGDQLVVEEHVRGHLTGYVARFDIEWVVRPVDNNGAYEGMLRDGVVILGLSLAEMQRPGQHSDAVELTMWPRQQHDALPS